MSLNYRFHVLLAASLHVCFWVVVGAEGFTTEEDQEMLSRIEKQMKKRFVIGSQVSEHAIVQDFTKQVTSCSYFGNDSLLRNVLNLTFSFVFLRIVKCSLKIKPSIEHLVLFCLEIPRKSNLQSDSPTVTPWRNPASCTTQNALPN